MAFLLAFLIALTSTANAATVTFCFVVDVDLGDAEDVGDDFINDNATNYPARGIWAIVKVTGAMGATVWSGFTDDGGATPGCTPALMLANGVNHTIRVRSHNRVRGSVLYLHDDEFSDEPYSHVSSTTFSAAGGTLTRTFVIPNEDHWSNMVVAAWAVWHGDTGPMDDIYLYMNACPSGSGVDGVCCTRDSGSGVSQVYIGGHTEKGVLAHFLGHCVWTAAGGPNLAIDEPDLYDGDIAPCNYDGGYPHNLLTREYQASNVWEGWAHFYWANAFNDVGEWVDDGECFINYYNPPLDWNANESVLDSGETDTLVSCAGSTNVEDEADYYWDYCSGDSNPFDGIDDNANMGTELDWLRHFWDLEGTFYSDFYPDVVGAADILTLIMDADPAAWNFTGHATGAGNPYEEIQEASAAAPEALFLTWGTLDGFNGIEQ